METDDQTGEAEDETGAVDVDVEVALAEEPRELRTTLRLEALLDPLVECLALATGESRTTIYNDAIRHYLSLRAEAVELGRAILKKQAEMADEDLVRKIRRLGRDLGRSETTDQGKRDDDDDREDGGLSAGRRGARGRGTGRSGGRRGAARAR